MIDVALLYIQQVLNRHIVMAVGSHADVVTLSGLSNSDSVQGENRNKVIITLVNLEHESNKQFYGGQRRDGDEFSQVNPAVYFNLDILISANFDDYSEALKLLTLVVGFFQENLVLERASHPLMPGGLESLKIEIENSPSAKTHNLWTALGVNYLPSMIYKLRHVGVQSGQVKGSSAAIKNISSSTGS